MSSPPSQPPQQAFNLSNRNSTGDRDAPGEGRLAAVGNTVRGPAPSNITRLGTQKMKFTPKAVPKKVTEEYLLQSIGLTLGRPLQNRAL